MPKKRKKSTCQEGRQRAGLSRRDRIGTITSLLKSGFLFASPDIADILDHSQHPIASIARGALGSLGERERQALADAFRSLFSDEELEVMRANHARRRKKQ